MHIVFFVESYGKNANINGVCVKNIADVLRNNGNEVTVFTSITEWGQLKHEKIDGVNVYRIKRDFMSWLTNMRKKTGTQLSDAAVKAYAKVNAALMFIVLKRWPQSSFFTQKRYIHRAIEVLNTNPPDIIIGAYFHIDEVISALKLKRYYPNVKTGVYMLDAMGGRSNPVFLHRFDMQQSVLRWEKMCMEYADILLPMEAHRNYFMSSGYPAEQKEKLRYVDIPLLKIKENWSRTQNKLNQSERIKVVYTGFTSRKTGSAEYFVKMLEHISGVEFHMYGRASEEVLQTIKASPIYEKRAFVHGFLDNEEIAQIQNDADFLVTFGSYSECMISGKIFEYMARKKPIICFYQMEEDINKEYLSRYPDVICFKEDEDKIKLNCQRLQEFILTETRPDITTEFLNNEFYKNTPEYTALEILKLGEGK